VTEETASEVCNGLRSVLEENAARSHTQGLTREVFVFQTNDLERERISGNWAVPILNYRTLGLETLLVSYLVETAEPLRIPQCHVEFHSISPRQEVVYEHQINDLTVLGIRYLGSVHMIVLVPDGEGGFEIVQRAFVDLNAFPSVGEILQRLIVENFSFFENDRVSVDFVEELVSRHADELGVFRTQEFFSISRSEAEILQSRACVDALRTARNEYARLARD